MRKLLVFAALVSAVSLSACSSAGGEVPQPAEKSTAAPTSTPAPSASAPELAAGPVGEPCADYSAPSSPALPAGSEEIAAAAEGAGLPDNITLKLGVQVITSVDDPGMFEVIARLCGGPLQEEELLTAGNSIAKAIYSVPTRDQVTLLMISPWVPDGDSVKQDENLGVIQTDYELFLWDTTNRSLESNWQ